MGTTTQVLLATKRSSRLFHGMAEVKDQGKCSQRIPRREKETETQQGAEQE